jgi:hypothetical protein
VLACLIACSYGDTVYTARETQYLSIRRHPVYWAAATPVPADMTADRRSLMRPLHLNLSGFFTHARPTADGDSRIHCGSRRIAPRACMITPHSFELVCAHALLPRPLVLQCNESAWQNRHVAVEQSPMLLSDAAGILARALHYSIPCARPP